MTASRSSRKTYPSTPRCSTPAPGSGRVLTLLNYRLHPVEWARILARSGTRLVIVQPEMAAPLRAALDDANVTVEILEIGPAYDAAVNAAVRWNVDPTPPTTPQRC